MAFSVVVPLVGLKVWQAWRYGISIKAPPLRQQRKNKMVSAARGRVANAVTRFSSNAVGIFVSGQRPSAMDARADSKVLVRKAAAPRRRRRAWQRRIWLKTSARNGQHAPRCLLPSAAPAARTCLRRTHAALPATRTRTSHAFIAGA
jgi:hypothetical protein